MDNYGHIYDHKCGPAGCLLNDKGIRRSVVKKLNLFVYLVKNYNLSILLLKPSLMLYNICLHLKIPWFVKKLGN